MLGILLIDKPRGITSHDVVNAVRRRLGTRRVGHSGTLDPMAEGLLVVAVGAATRFLQYLPLEPKEYVATLEFGKTTDSFDAEGETTSVTQVPPDLRERVEAALPEYRGLIRQTPPMFSAVKVKGKPLYAYARAGQEMPREPRTVHIGAYEIVEMDGVSATMRVECSGGTYVRTLADDLGRTVGCGAHLTALIRTGVGRFRREDAVALDSVGLSDLVPLEEALPPLPLVRVAAEIAEKVRHGLPVRLDEEPEGNLVALLEERGVFSIARRNGGAWQPDCVIPAEVLSEPEFRRAV